jgi:hypothetical protein
LYYPFFETNSKRRKKKKKEKDIKERRREKGEKKKEREGRAAVLWSCVEMRLINLPFLFNFGFVY